MRRSTLFAFGYVGAGIAFLVNAVTGVALHTGSLGMTRLGSVSQCHTSVALAPEPRAQVWAVLGLCWLGIGGYATLKSGEFDELRSSSVISYNYMLTVVLGALTLLSLGVVLNLLKHCL